MDFDPKRKCCEPSNVSFLQAVVYDKMMGQRRGLLGRLRRGRSKSPSRRDWNVCARVVAGKKAIDPSHFFPFYLAVNTVALKDPVPVYNAASNLEAQLIRNHLIAEGIEAYAVEDVSQVGTWAMGLIPEIHKPQVFVERWNAEQARSLIEDYEDRSAPAAPMEAEQEFCYGCGEPVTRGAPTCTACGKPLDWSAEPDDIEPKESQFVAMKGLKKPIAWLYLGPFIFFIALALLELLSKLVALISR